MKKTQSNQLFEKLESIRNEIEGVEYWSARELQELFDYTQWRNFEKVVQKAIISCENGSQNVSAHFAEVSKMVDLGSKTSRVLKDYALTRYACYLIAQNGDPNKEEIAFAQGYFALKTRKQELIEKRIAEAERVREREKLTLSEKLLSQLAFERGVDSEGFAFIRAKGDEAFFGGNNTQAMKEKLAVGKGKPLADYLPTVTIWGKGLATGITNHNMQTKNLEGTNQIAEEHITNNDAVRQLLISRGIVPEELPAAEDVKKVKRRLNSEGKKLIDKKKK